MIDRPHCLNAGACPAAKPTTHCRRCVAARLGNDPEIQARRLANLRAKFADPVFAAAQRERAREQFGREARSPEGRERRRKSGAATFHLTLGSAHARERAHSPEARAKRGRKISERKLAWCPPAYRAAYIHLLRYKGFKKPDARRLIEEQIARDRAAEAKATARERAQSRTFEQQLARVAAGAELVPSLRLRTAEPEWTLGGIATAAL